MSVGLVGNPNGSYLPNIIEEKPAMIRATWPLCRIQQYVWYHVYGCLFQFGFPKNDPWIGEVQLWGRHHTYNHGNPPIPTGWIHHLSGRGHTFRAESFTTFAAVSCRTSSPHQNTFKLIKERTGRVVDAILYSCVCPPNVKQIPTDMPG